MKEEEQPQQQESEERMILGNCLEALAAFIRHGAANYRSRHLSEYGEIMDLVDGGHARLIIRLEENSDAITISYCVELAGAELPKPMFFISMQKPPGQTTAMH